MGDVIDDQEMAMVVLNGLLERFTSLMNAIDALGKEDESFSFEHVKSRLLQEEQRTEIRAKASTVKSKASALVTSRLDGQQMYHKWVH